MDWRERIEINPDVLMGKPIIRGSRLSVSFILDVLSEGWTFEQILANYPQLFLEDIRAAIAYGSSRVKDEEILPLKFGT